MATTIKVDGKEIEMVEDLSIGELCEAEKALGMDMDAGSGARLAVMVFASLRKAEPDKLSSVHANEALRAKLTSLAEVDEGPPAEAADAADNGAGHTPPLTSGLPH